jgi:hypothetical protein
VSVTEQAQFIQPSLRFPESVRGVQFVFMNSQRRSDDLLRRFRVSTYRDLVDSNLVTGFD